LELRMNTELAQPERDALCAPQAADRPQAVDRPQERLRERVAIVTGAAQGLGEAIAHRLAAEGARVVVADLNQEGAEKVVADIEQRHARGALAVRCDVTNEGNVAAMVAAASEGWGRLDILVSNAGILIAGDVTEFAASDWRKVIEVNLVGYFLCARAAAKVMRRQRRGVIIQINSKSGKKGSFRNSAYAASKFGGIGLTQSLALELAPDGIRVNAVCPGNLLDSPLWVDSLYEQYAKRWGLTPEQVRRKYEEQVPLGRGCTYDDVCNVVAFLASDEASYMTGQAINVTGGQEMR
jgi:sorbitol-6-phosphate 2-dehydrogenase